MPLKIPSPTTTTVEQTDETQLLATVTLEGFSAPDNVLNSPHFIELPHDELTVVWTPASGKKPHIISFIVSTEAAGVCYIYKNDTEFLHLEFNEKKSQPFGTGTELDFDVDTVIKAKFVGAAASPSGWITIVGHEQ